MTFSPPVSARAWIWLLVVMAAGFLAFSDARMVDVTLPLAVGLLGSLGFFLVLWHRGHRGIPWFEIGAVYMAIVALYMAYPLAGFLVLGGTYTSFNDNRLLALHPDAAAIGRIGWLYVSHLVGFACAYLATRGRLPMVEPRPRPPGLFIVLSLVVTFALLEIFQLVVGLAYNTSASTYAESYLVSRRLPLFVAQLVNHLGGMKYPISLALLAVLFTHYRTARPLLVAWLLLATVLSVARLGSRTDVVLLLLAAAAMYHMLVRPVAARLVAVAAGVGLAGFIAFGMLRGERLFVDGGLAVNPFRVSTEFESLFANAVDIDRAKHMIGSLPFAFYVADLTALVPQQFLPFTKVEPATWYVTTFMPAYAASGGGMAFGTIAEAILTGGWVSALVRGAAIGICFASIHRFCRRRPRGFWSFVLYIWIVTLAYQVFRNTSFSILVLFVYRFVPAVVVVTAVAILLRRVSAGWRHPLPPRLARAQP